MRPWIALSNARCSDASSASRPTIGETSRPCHAWRFRGHADESPRFDRLGLAFEVEEPCFFDLDGVPDQPVRWFADEDLAGGGGLLEASSHGYRRAGGKDLSEVCPNHDLTRVDARADLDADAVVTLQLLVEDLELLPHLRCRANRPEGVVFTDGWDAEHRHDRIPDELLDPTAVAFDRTPHLVEVARHHPPERFGVKALSEGGPSGHVGEDDGDRLAHFRFVRHSRKATLVHHAWVGCASVGSS